MCHAPAPLFLPPPVQPIPSFWNMYIKKTKLLVHLEKREIVIVSPKFSRIFIFGTEILRKNSKGVAIRIFDSPPVV